ncbi:MAG: hypothetical protein HRU38_01780 [Saccharospirillaceae bacterium]|nr:hypothetical protein [Colwellia sp.]NRB77388.1 hypothetical protein [Saccharospirillaceae bacterium]
MWRNFSIFLCLITLAQTANALPMENFDQNASTSPLTLQLKIANVETSLSNILLLDESEPEDTFNLPRLYQASASVFSNELQNTPNYFLVIEFFKIKLNAGLFKNLANPPVQLNWYEQLSHRSNSTRLSGWKDGNTLYASRVNYHS